MARTLDVQTLSGSLDPDAVGRVIDALLTASLTDTKLAQTLRRAFTLVNDRLLGTEERPMLTAEQSRIFLPIAPTFGLFPPDRASAIETLLVASYARATELLHRRGNTAILRDRSRLFDRVKAGLNKADRDVVGQFLVSIAVSAARAPEVSAKLHHAAESIRRQLPGLARWEKASKVLLREKGDGDPTCWCHSVPTCEPEVGCVSFCYPWWVCVLIPIIIIIIVILGPEGGL